MNFNITDLKNYINYKVLIVGIFFTSVLYFSFSHSILTDSLYFCFLLISLFILFSSEVNKLLVKHSSIYFFYYFSTRLIFMFLVIFGVFDNNLSKLLLSLTSTSNLIIPVVVFLILLIFYWQILAKGLVRFGEIIARFYLDALPGQQSSIDTYKREGIISALDAQNEKRQVINTSIQLGSLDAGMKVISGNIVLICFSTIMFIGARIFYFYSSNETITVDLILKNLSEASVFGSLLIFDGIMFMLPILSSINSIISGDNNEIKFSSKERENFYFIISSIILYFFLLLITKSLIWQPLIIIFAISIYINYSNANNFINSSKDCKNKNRLFASKIESSNTLCIPRIFVKRNALSIELFTNNLIDKFPNLKYLNNIKYNYSNDVNFNLKNNDGSSINFNIPEYDFILELPSSISKILFNEKNLYFSELIPSCSFIKLDSNIFYDEVFSTYKYYIRSDEWLINEIILNSFDDCLLNDISSEDLIKIIRNIRITNPEGSEYTDLITQVGYKTILESSNEIIKRGVSNLDINSVIDAIFLSDDKEDIFKIYLNRIFEKRNPNFYSNDGQVRSFLLSENTLDYINLKQEYNEITSINLDKIIEKIIMDISSLKNNRKLPILFIVPNLEDLTTKYILNEIRKISSRIIFVVKNEMPEALNYYPLGTY